MSKARIIKVADVKKIERGRKDHAMPTTAHQAAELLVRSESEGLLPDLPEALRPNRY